MTGSDWWGIAGFIAFVWCVIWVSIPPRQATLDTMYGSGTPGVARRGRLWSRESALVVAGIAWLLTGLSAGKRLPALSWWLVVWVAESCALLGYAVGRGRGSRDATQRLERDERERTEARDRFAREQAVQVQGARQN